MSPAELKLLNIIHFQRLLNRTTDLDERMRLEGLMAEERAKPDSAYPSEDPPGARPACMSAPAGAGSPDPWRWNPHNRLQ